MVTRFRCSNTRSSLADCISRCVGRGSGLLPGLATLRAASLAAEAGGEVAESRTMPSSLSPRVSDLRRGRSDRLHDVACLNSHCGNDCNMSVRREAESGLCLKHICSRKMAQLNGAASTGLVDLDLDHFPLPRPKRGEVCQLIRPELGRVEPASGELPSASAGGATSAADAEPGGGGSGVRSIGAGGS